MKQIKIEDLECIAIGAAILGSGGGGDTRNDLMIAKHFIQKYGAVSCISADELDENDLVVPIAFMGALLITKEKLPSGREFKLIIEKINERYKNKRIVLMAAEIGGANAFCAISCAAILKLPLLDADTLGRAFPELQMSSCNVNGILPSPAFLSDGRGNTVIIDAKDSLMVENLARAITVKMGSSACVSLYLMNGKEAKSAIIEDTLTRSIEIGKAHKKAVLNNTDPIEAILKKTDGKLIFQGLIIDVNQKIKDGFLQGSVTFDDGKNTCSISYQNENLIAKINDEICITTPDIITICDTQSGIPITCESLNFSQRVSVIGILASDVWKTKKGLDLVGPRVFGFDVDYKPIKEEIVR